MLYVFIAIPVHKACLLWSELIFWAIAKLSLLIYPALMIGS
jgi:hypothetical protein